MIQVCISQHQCILRLNSGDSVSIESNCQFTSSNGVSIAISDFAASSVVLTGLVEKEITDATHNGAGGLRLEFEDQTFLEILNDTSQYESFQLNLEGQIHVA